MSHLPQSILHQARQDFTAATGVPPVPKAKALPPFSLRLSPDERAQLEAMAGSAPLGRFIKAKVFDGTAPARSSQRKPLVKDHAALAQVLGMLGQMRLASNLNQLAKAANIGTLPLTPEVEEDLTRACAAVLAMKAELMRALGYPARDTDAP